MRNKVRQVDKCDSLGIVTDGVLSEDVRANIDQVRTTDLVEDI